LNHESHKDIKSEKTSHKDTKVHKDHKAFVCQISLFLQNIFSKFENKESKKKIFSNKNLKFFLCDLCALRVFVRIFSEKIYFIIALNFAIYSSAFASSITSGSFS